MRFPSRAELLLAAGLLSTDISESATTKGKSREDNAPETSIEFIKDFSARIPPRHLALFFPSAKPERETISEPDSDKPCDWSKYKPLILGNGIKIDRNKLTEYLNTLPGENNFTSITTIDRETAEILIKTTGDQKAREETKIHMFVDVSYDQSGVVNNKLVFINDGVKTIQNLERFMQELIHEKSHSLVLQAFHQANDNERIKILQLLEQRIAEPDQFRVPHVATPTHTNPQIAYSLRLREYLTKIITEYLDKGTHNATLMQPDLDLCKILLHQVLGLKNTDIDLLKQQRTAVTKSTVNEQIGGLESLFIKAE